MLTSSYWEKNSFFFYSLVVLFIFSLVSFCRVLDSCIQGVLYQLRRHKIGLRFLDSNVRITAFHERFMIALMVCTDVLVVT